ncbi:unnamed protein product [Oikopleura dioica]|uniref:S-methyl-5'-thioadenosine phosphorylase n=1 Tax=Oikopleura dioica TaxID=34765 RepID=E4YBT7_OIKDI|nr:unnamed protein product [Oikopleura dioica]
MSTVIAIIGGTGLDDPTIVTNRKELEDIEDTPWGEPSTIFKGEVNGETVFIQSRHGRLHNKSPSQVNYCANLWALKRLGVTHIVATTACGSLKEEYSPGDLVVLSDYIDMTKGYRVNTHVGTAVENGGPKGIIHLPSKPAYDEDLREILIESLKESGVDHKTQGTAVCIEGPRFSSYAESCIFRDVYKAEIVNMTACPETSIAREMGMHYASIAMVTDYDCWKENEEVNVANVTKQMLINAKSVGKVVPIIIRKIKEQDWRKSRESLLAAVKTAIMEC